MTRAGFPHSDILGSRFVCQLPEAYRRLQRPSSAPSAKASTLCPYKLDHKDHSKRCSRPLCSSQATTGSGTLTPAPTHTTTTHNGIATVPAVRPSGTSPQSLTPRPAPEDADRVCSDPETTTFRLFPQDPTACPADPLPSSHRSHPNPERLRRTRRHQLESRP
jgi:hypothetical protein